MGQDLNLPRKRIPSRSDSAHERVRKMTHGNIPSQWMTIKWRVSPLTGGLSVGLGPDGYARWEQECSVKQTKKNVEFPGVTLRGKEGRWLMALLEMQTKWLLIKGVTDVQLQVCAMQSAKPSLPVTPLSAPHPKSSVIPTTERPSGMTIKSIKTDSGARCLGSMSGSPTYLLQDPGKCYIISLPQLPHLKSGDNDNNYLSMHVWHYYEGWLISNLVQLSAEQNL